MRVTLSIIVLTFLAIIFHEPIQSQSLKSSFESNLDSRNNEKESRDMSSKLTSKGKKSQAKEVIEQFIDGVFVERNVLPTFEALTSFETWDATDEDVIGQSGLLKKVPANLKHQTYSRIAAAIWNYEFQSLLLTLGKDRLGDSSEIFPLKTSDYDYLRSEIIEKSSLKLDLDFEGLDEQEIQKKLDKSEIFFEELEIKIFERVDKSVYQENINRLKKAIKIKKTTAENRNYYVATIRGLNLFFIMSIRDEKIKIIGISDGI